jgi:hypothetical protein
MLLTSDKFRLKRLAFPVRSHLLHIRRTYLHISRGGRDELVFLSAQNDDTTLSRHGGAEATLWFAPALIPPARSPFFTSRLGLLVLLLLTLLE